MRNLPEPWGKQTLSLEEFYLNQLNCGVYLYSLIHRCVCGRVKAFMYMYMPMYGGSIWGEPLERHAVLPRPSALISETESSMFIWSVQHWDCGWAPSPLTFSGSSRSLTRSSCLRDFAASAVSPALRWTLRARRWLCKLKREKCHVGRRNDIWQRSEAGRKLVSLRENGRLQRGPTWSWWRTVVAQVDWHLCTLP